MAQSDYDICTTISTHAVNQNDMIQFISSKLGDMYTVLPKDDKPALEPQFYACRYLNDDGRFIAQPGSPAFRR